MMLPEGSARFPSILIGLLGVSLLAVPPARADVDLVLPLIAAGERSLARASLDSLLATSGLSEEERGRALVQRAFLEEDALKFETRAQQALATDAGRAVAGRLTLELGHVALAQGKLSDALTAFRDARQTGMEEEGSLWEGLTLLALGDGEAARAALRQARESGNASIRTRARMTTGYALQLSGDLDRAMETFRELGQDSQGSWRSTALWQEGLCLEGLGQLEPARMAWARLVAEIPGSFEAPLAQAKLRSTEGMTGPQAADEAVTVEEAPIEVVIPDAAGVRFAIQVGAFSVAANAEGLASALAGREVPGTFIERGDDALSRVYVGYFSSREQAEAIGDSLSGEFGFGFTVVARETP